MITQQEQLEVGLSASGWEIVGREKSNLDWWADEIWKIESIWSPVGFTIYLTFLVDPQQSRVRKKGEDVWAIGASINRPKEREDGVEALVPLRPKWGKRLHVFILEVNNMRASI